MVLGFLVNSGNCLVLIEFCVVLVEWFGVSLVM